MKKVDYFVANPAGNITIFVTSPAERSEYQEIAGKLLAIEEHHAEQVGFIKAGNRMEMCGLEFCGNASRSFALWYAQNRAGVKGAGTVTVDVSGAEHPLDVSVDTSTAYTRIAMPDPLSIRTWQSVPGVRESGDVREGVLVDLGGIMHLVLWDVPASAELFDHYKDLINQMFNPAAMGVMFLNTKTLELTPVVYVRDVDTTYFEGSCGSGSTATAIALSYQLSDGEHSYLLKQPAGDITATTIVHENKIERVYIEGPVELGSPLTLEY